MKNLVNAKPRRLGSLPPVGPLGFGCWRLVDKTPGAARSRIEAALESDMNLVDTADVYGLDWGGDGFGLAEELLGAALAEAPGLRERIVLATKGGIKPPIPYDQSPSYLREACEASLRRLGVEAIDLYQVHRPDLFTHPEQLAGVLTELREAGKIREAGVSNFTVSHYEALSRFLPFPLVASQPRFSANFLGPLWDGTLDACMRDGMVPLAWSPLDGGRLTSGAEPDGDGPRGELLQTLDRLAEREGATREATALAFVLAHPSRPTALVGSQTPSRIAAAAGALRVRLDRNDCYDVIEASTGERLP